MGSDDGRDGYGDKCGSNSNGNNTSNGDGNEGWRATKSAMARAARAMAMATKRAMAMAANLMMTATKRAMAMVGEGNVNNGKSNGQQ
jgi:hypothetical protein